MKKWYWKKTFIVLIIVMFSLLNAFPVLAKKSDDKIKVGYFLMSGYQEIDQNGEFTGYGYEYLMEIAKYTEWDYDFIIASFDECLQMLEDGRIDIMGSILKSEKREEIFDYAKIPSGITSSTLITSKDNEKYAYEDFEAFDGMRIGVLDGYIINGSLLKYCEKNNFNVDIVKFQSQNIMNEALVNGEVDSLLIRDIADINNNKIIAKFDTSPYYFAVTKGNTKVLDELNEALENIHTTERFYESKLFKNYYSEDENVALTREEQDYINETEYVTVALYGKLPGVSYYNPTTKEFSGIVVSILELISEKIGLPFSYELFPYSANVATYLKNSDTNLVGPIYDSSIVTFADSVQRLESVLSTKTVIITRDGEYYEEDDFFTIALPKTMYFLGEPLKNYFRNATIIECNGVKEALNKVSQKEADITFNNEIMANYRLQSPFYENLSICCAYGGVQDMTFATEKGKDELLISVLNKAILSITDRELNQVIINNTVSNQYEKSFREWVYENRISLQVAIAFFLLCCGLFTFILLFRRRFKKMNEEKKVLEKKRKEDLLYQETLLRKASHDTLTGLYNRAGEEIIDDLLEELGEGTLFMIDMDDLKNTNDTYGHEAGDAILAHIGQTLDSLFRSSDVVARIGGDEFIAFIPGLSQSEIAIQKANKVMDELKKPYYLNGEVIPVSCSIGIAISPEHGFTYKELRAAADQTMYRVKYKSKGKFAVYSKDQEELMELSNLGKKLRGSVHKLENILNNIHGGIALYKLTDHLEPVYFTDGVLQIHGMEREEYADWVGNDIKISIHEKDEKLLQNFIVNMKTNGIADEILRLKHKNGNYVWVHVSGCIVGTYEDSKLCQVLLKEMSKYTNLFAKIFEDDKDAICVSDTRNSQVLYMNEKACQLAGIPKEEFRDKKCFEVMWNANQECKDCFLKMDHTCNTLRHVIRNGKKYLVESKIIDWDGVNIHVEYIKEKIDS